MSLRRGWSGAVDKGGAGNQGVVSSLHVMRRLLSGVALPGITNPHPLVSLAFVLVLLAPWLGCGYHTGGKSVLLPADLHTIAIPAFQNNTNVYRVEQVLTEAVVREFLARTRYRVISQDDGSADAVLRGTVLSVLIAPVTYDSQAGHERASTATVTVSMRVALVDRHGKTLYENASYVFREQYQISRDPSSFFQEEIPAVDRLALDFGRTLVSNVLEAY